MACWTTSVPDFGPHPQVQVRAKAFHSRRRLLGAPRPRAEGKTGLSGAHGPPGGGLATPGAWGYPGPRRGFGGLDGPCAALHGLVDVDLIPGKVDVFPEEGGGLPRAKAGVEDGENPQPRGMGLGQGQDVPPLLSW